MGCNCASEKQVKHVLNEFGADVTFNSGHTLGEKLKNFLLNISLSAAIVCMAPFVFSYLLYKSHSKNNKISIVKFFRLSRNVKQEY